VRLCRLWCHLHATVRISMPTCRQPLVGTPSTPRTATHTRAPSHSRAFCDSINMTALEATILIIANVHGRQAASYYIAARDLYERSIRPSPKGNSVDDMVVCCIRRCSDDLASYSALGLMTRVGLGRLRFGSDLQSAA